MIRRGVRGVAGGFGWVGGGGGDNTGQGPPPQILGGGGYHTHTHTHTHTNKQSMFIRENSEVYMSTAGLHVKLLKSQVTCLPIEMSNSHA